MVANTIVFNPVSHSHFRLHKINVKGKVTLKSNGNEALSDEFLLKSNGDEALKDVFPQKGWQ